MATLIGVVSQVIGEVYAVAGDGTRRPLSEGDRVFAGEQIVTGAAGSIAVAMSNGQQLTLGRDSSLNLTEQMLAGSSNQPAPTAETPPAAPSDGDLTDVEQLQAAIEAGVDPTLEGEATAAGPGAGGAGGAGGVGGDCAGPLGLALAARGLVRTHAHVDEAVHVDRRRLRLRRRGEPAEPRVDVGNRPALEA